MLVELFEKRAISETEKYIREYFENEGSGHDWWHIHRVRNMALKLAEKEGGNLFIIEMAALLHDLDDWKLNDGNESKTLKWLKSIKLDESSTKAILEIIDQVSFKGAGVENRAISVEAKIVQDADRLDAIGAIGIARTFAYGGHKSRPIYNPEVKPVMHADFESYKNNNAPTINHFYEKLLLLKKSLITGSAIEIAKNRHIFMETFLEHFFAEWEGHS